MSYGLVGRRATEVAAAELLARAVLCLLDRCSGVGPEASRRGALRLAANRVIANNSADIRELVEPVLKQDQVWSDQAKLTREYEAAEQDLTAKAVAAEEEVRAIVARERERLTSEIEALPVEVS